MTSNREGSKRRAYASLVSCELAEVNILSLFSSSRAEMSDDETSSHSSQSSLSIDDESMPENVIRPYQFEPEFSSSEENVA